jgi:thiol:disulfide interchange protein DsbD
MSWRLLIRLSARRFLSTWISLWMGLFLLMGMSHSARAADDFLPVDEAFKLQASVGQAGELVLDFEIGPKTHLYRERLLLQGLPPEVKLGKVDLPTGKSQFDETFGKDVEVYYGHLSAKVPLESGVPAGKPAFVQVGYQGCADAGLCYPPQTRFFRLTVAEGGKVTAVAPATEEEAQVAGKGAAATAASSATPQEAAGSAPAATKSSGNSIENALASGNLFKIGGVFFIAGLLLSFTPCVLPMVPILSSIIVGEGNVGRLRGFTLALSYSQGMALVYTALGVVAGLLGEGLASSLQNPWVLGTFGVMLVLLALSMFGAYELQMPSFIQGHLTERSGKLQGGSLLGVFLMGVMSALIVGPCVTGPLAGALVYISQTKDVVLGGTALYALAWGMSVPLLLVGVSAGSLLPSAGMWMEAVKTFFGMLLLGVAWWLVSPVLNAMALLGLLGVLLALGGAFLGAFDTIGPTASVKHRAAKAFGWVLVVLAVFELFGAVTGATSPWVPLSELKTMAVSAAPGGVAQAATDKLPFKRVTTPEQLDAAVAEAAAKGQIAVLDFYADWCVACKEFEHITFADPKVRAMLGKATLIQADVTETNPDTKALLKRFGLFGPPGIIFFDAKGQPNTGVRVIGFEKPEEFIPHLQAAGL